MQETFDWIKPSPLWQPNGQDFRDKTDFFRPVLLEMQTDDFMNEFFAAVRAPKPDALKNAILKPAAPSRPLKLFQPINVRYYLACASLCCRIPGFPDRDVRTGEGEKIFFVIRKVAGGQEHAWIVGDGNKGQWKPLANQSDPDLKKEERLPMFPTTAGNTRQVMFGYIPVASRDTYEAGPTSPLAVVSPVDPRPGRYDENIHNPLIELINLAARTKLPDPLDPLSASARSTDSVAEEMSLFLLLDLGKFLSENIPNVFNALPGPAALAKVAEQNLLSFLINTIVGKAATTATLAAAIKDVASKASQIEELSGGDPLPVRYNLRNMSQATVVDLKSRVNLALPVYDPAKQPPPPPVQVPKLLAQEGEAYLLRCVYERAQCDPPHQYISKPSEQFLLASVLDPDGPARQIRIELPRDVSIAGLRKFKKGVGFAMSDAMRNKLKMITGAEKALLKDEALNSEGGLTIGFICTFSFQIIFIVAFFLLLVFVIILNIVFWWLPFFRICLPFPMKSK
jgi:hypothetical protein